MIRALVFDFDGLILETEGPEFRSWQEAYEAHGAVLPLATWVACVGGSAADFDPYADLEVRLGRSVDRDALRRRRRARFAELVAAERVLPGVEACLDAAHARGLAVAVASNSRREWVEPHLARLGLRGRIAHVSCWGDGLRPKPAPDLYLSAVAALGLAPGEALAFEDSPRGVTAAKAAGLWCVAVPHALTHALDFGAADLRLSSLADLPLAVLLG